MHAVDTVLDRLRFPEINDFVAETPFVLAEDDVTRACQGADRISDFHHAIVEIPVVLTLSPHVLSTDGDHDDALSDKLHRSAEVAIDSGSLIS
jgi:hypothetical protein